MKLRPEFLDTAWQRCSRREKLILCTAALAVPLLLADTLVWNPWRLQMKALNARVAQAEQDVAHLTGAQFAQGAHAPKDAGEAQRIDALRERLVQTEQLAQAARAQIVSPARMAATLREVTESRGAVKVMALRSLPVTPLADAGPTRLYRHSFELQVEGSYADIARYVESLEQGAGVLRWHAIELDASRYPVVGARLEVFTLSEQSSWIQL